jgi:hypothetical protein
MHSRFNWGKIYRKGNGRLTAINNIFNEILMGEESSFKYKGQSYLINLEGLFEYKIKKKVPLREMIDYIYIASFRSYGLYLAAEIVTLPIAHQPFDLKRLQKNQLLKTTETDITFRLEK